MSASDSHAHDGSSSAAPADTKLVVYAQHVGHPEVTAEVAAACESLRAEIAKEAVYIANEKEASEFVSQQNLHRYLRARQFDAVKAKKLMVETLSWRLAYKPWAITAAQVEHECATGKIRVLPELDRHHRPIIVMDSSRENTKGHDSQLRHLVWQLERASRKFNSEPVPEGAASPPPVEKYCLFINLERNSIWNSPPMKTSLETLKTLTDRFPEHLGHAVVYKPGLLFATLWAACQPLLDPKTKSKIVFIRGDVKEGSKNDAILREVICDNWRALCDRPKDDYDHAAFWPQVLADEAAWNAKHPPHEPVAVAAAAPSQ